MKRVRQVLRRATRPGYPRWSPHAEIAIVVALLVAGALLGRCAS